MFTWCCLRSIRSSCYMSQLRHIRHGQNDKLFKELQRDEEYPRITVPQKMVENLAKHNLRVARERAVKEKLKLTDDKLLIMCKRKELNHYRGQKYKVFDPKQLASYGWKHRNCPSDSFRIIASGKNLSMSDEDDGFGMMKLDDGILKFLGKEGIQQPTHIQSLMIPEMVKRNHLACAAETGSGKTYAYLIPCVQSILKDIEMDSADNRSKPTNSPTVIIVTPTVELAKQVKRFCDKVMEFTQVTYRVLHGSGSNLQNIKKKAEPMDILIATPGILKRVIEREMISVSNLRTLILDEADTLLDDSFNHIITSIFHKSEIDTSIAVQVVLVSATFPRDIGSILGDYLSEDSFTKITTAHLHMISKHVNHNFLKMKSADKLENILSLVKYRKMKSMMIFCNTNDTCHWLSQTLRETNVSCDCLSGFNDPRERSQVYQAFVDGEFSVLVCTDIASRGLDTTDVQHVVNFDCPNFISDYLHRAGRVGRIGSTHTGQVTSFVVHPWDVDLVWKIEVAVRQGKQVHNVNANIKRKIQGRMDDKYEQENGN